MRSWDAATALLTLDMTDELSPSTRSFPAGVHSWPRNGTGDRDGGAMNREEHIDEEEAHVMASEALPHEDWPSDSSKDASLEESESSDDQPEDVVEVEPSASEVSGVDLDHVLPVLSVHTDAREGATLPPSLVRWPCALKG